MERLESPGYLFGRQNAVKAFFAAVRDRYPAAFVELRDLSFDPLEGEHVIEAGDFASHRSTLLNNRAGTLFPVAAPLQEITTEGLQDKTPMPGRPGQVLRPPAVVIDDDLGSFREPLLVFFIPPAIIAWSTKWTVATPRVQAAAVHLRRQWKRRPDAADNCELLWGALPMLLGTQLVVAPTEEQWQSWKFPPIGASPMQESANEFLTRAREHYDLRARAWFQKLASETERAGVLQPSTGARRFRELQRHADWLARVQVGAMSPADVARQDIVTRVAVDRAVRTLASLIELPLRPIRKTGRPPGRREHASRRRTSKK